MAATQQGSVTVHEKSGMPIMLTQAIIIAATLCVCELVCAPMYVGFIPNLFPLLPWALVAMLLAVAFHLYRRLRIALVCGIVRVPHEAKSPADRLFDHRRYSIRCLDHLGGSWAS